MALHGRQNNESCRHSDNHEYLLRTQDNAPGPEGMQCGQVDCCDRCICVGRKSIAVLGNLR